MVGQSMRFIYFDLGRVIVHFDLEKMCRQMAAVSQVTSQEVHTALYDTGLMERYEIGAVGDDEFYEDYCEATGARPDRDALAAAANEIFELNLSIIPVIGQLRAAGFRLGILSNTCRSHWEYCRRQYSILQDLFSVYVLSYEVCAMKPDTRIFLTAAEMAGVQPREVFYLDDIAGHIAGARTAGFDAVQYTATSLLVGDLRERGVEFNY